jgi:hypothetical protein
MILSYKSIKNNHGMVEALKKHLIICFFIWLISKRGLLVAGFRYSWTLSAGNDSASCPGKRIY